LVSPHVHGLANRLEDLAGLLAEHEAQHEAGGPPKDRLSPRSCVSDPVSYTAVLPIGERTVAFLSGLLAGERVGFQKVA